MYMASPEYMATYARHLVQAGAKIVGGCCGTTPEHIRAMADGVRPLAPDVARPAPVRCRRRYASPKGERRPAKEDGPIPRTDLSARSPGHARPRWPPAVVARPVCRPLAMGREARSGASS